MWLVPAEQNRINSVKSSCVVSAKDLVTDVGGTDTPIILQRKILTASQPSYHNSKSKEKYEDEE
jgi:hypothetical protein